MATFTGSGVTRGFVAGARIAAGARGRTPPAAHAARTVAAFVGLSVGLSIAAAAGAVAGIAPAMLPFVLATGPLAVATALAAREGRARELFATARQRPAHPGSYAALLLPIGATLVVLPLAVLLGAPTAGLFDKVLPSLVIVPLVVLLPAVAEELAWRGFALDRLLTVTSPAVGATILAVPWVGLHLALFLPGQMYEGLAVWPSVVAVGSLAVLTSWVYIRSGGSVLLTALFHALFNGVTPLMSGLAPAQSWELRALVVAAFAAVVLASGGLRNTQGDAIIDG